MVKCYRWIIFRCACIRCFFLHLLVLLMSLLISCFCGAIPQDFTQMQTAIWFSSFVNSVWARAEIHHSNSIAIFTRTNTNRLQKQSFWIRFNYFWWLINRERLTFFFKRWFELCKIVQSGFPLHAFQLQFVFIDWVFISMNRTVVGWRFVISRQQINVCTEKISTAVDYVSVWLVCCIAEHWIYYISTISSERSTACLSTSNFFISHQPTQCWHSYILKHIHTHTFPNAFCNTFFAPLTL